MSTEPLPLWQMLKDEYESFHGLLDAKYVETVAPLVAALHNPPPNNAWLTAYLTVNLTRPQSRAALAAVTAASVPQDVRDDLISTLYNLLGDPNLIRKIEATRAADILQAAGITRTLEQLREAPLASDEIIRVNQHVLDRSFPGVFSDFAHAGGTPALKLRGIYFYIHRKKHSALCLSGGGIRSATFNLGIIQGLARHGLLGQFNYLSTVSGGGFVGGWLSAWIGRHPRGIEGVVKALSSPPETPTNPDPSPVAHLRTYSNFLSPKVGLLSADTWTMVATIVRNLLLNWLVFVPFILAALIFPRLWIAFVLHRPTFGFSETLSLGVGFVAVIVALSFIGLNLPSSAKRNDNEGRFIIFCLLPLTIAAMALSAYWTRYTLRVPAPERWGWLAFVTFSEVMIMVPWLVTALVRIVGAKKKPQAIGMFLAATPLLLIAHLITGSLLYVIVNSLSAFSQPAGAPNVPANVNHALIYACVAVPAMLGILMLSAVLVAGFASRYLEESDMEWWARAGAWCIIVLLAWSVVSGLVIYGPVMILALAVWTSQWDTWTEAAIGIGAAVGTIGGVVSGALTLLGGFSAKTPANADETHKRGGDSRALGILTSLLGPLFFGFLIIVLSLATTLLLTSDGGRMLHAWLTNRRFETIHTFTPDISGYLDIIYNSSFRFLMVAFALIFVVGLFMGRIINTNRFSLHYFWRNRIIRAYLGATSYLRGADHARNRNLFTGFDTDDNIQMHELRSNGSGTPSAPRIKLLHVLNIALNLVGSEKLAWQERKAESFTVSPLHCGNYWLGYRDAKEYGGADGISLGTAVAISGAFVSPNMGYMQSSPVVRFLMTLFNARFGWWLGNPGAAGGRATDKTRTYDRNSPRLSVMPIVEEALGMTDDESPYVYLSDGGHFENLGLYEMVLRRCRFIIVSDASSDDQYTFESLGASIRKIRIDFGIPIEFEAFYIKGRATDRTGVYCAIGKIRYSCVDGNPRSDDGTVVLLKPSLTGDEPRDILNYANQNTSFPQEIIVDQWFSESQFESYRALGSHIVDEVSKVKGRKLDDCNKFETFDDFEQNLADTLQDISINNFERRARDFLKELAT